MRETFSAIMFAFNCLMIDILEGAALYYSGNQWPYDIFMIVLMAQIFTIFICVYFFKEES